MEYTIVDQPAFTLTGQGLRVSTKNGQNFTLIPQFWEDCEANGLIDRIKSWSSPKLFPSGAVFGICTDFAADMSEFTYAIAAERSEGAAPAELIEFPIPPASWACFTAIGPLPESIQSVWKRIWSEFFDVSSYSHGNGPEIEIYFGGNPSSADFTCEVRIPVVKK